MYYWYFSYIYHIKQIFSLNCVFSLMNPLCIQLQYRFITRLKNHKPIHKHPEYLSEYILKLFHPAFFAEWLIRNETRPPYTKSLARIFINNLSILYEIHPSSQMQRKNAQSSSYSFMIILDGSKQSIAYQYSPPSNSPFAHRFLDWCHCCTVALLPYFSIPAFLFQLFYSRSLFWFSGLGRCGALHCGIGYLI